MANRAKKFGAFSGVFAPSILTILGVIMYMRLGWVVGQSGLLAALFIIIIAHVISITTGLSISSIATDKKIETGGIYYILSRSLGLPIGGAIGIAIFIGTALSISLYLIGFSENFLGIESISQYIGLEPSVNSYRITGSAMLVVLLILGLISTSLVIRTQYVILGAIALSLISIGVGFFINSSYQPETVQLATVPGGVPLEVVFGVFFPAVTGFTAGVAMSGDLKNPKSSIPKGTLAAIFVGLIIYITLAIVFALFVKRDILINDINFLMKIAWVSPLVIAGIWGATLSSALGGILGGPRILQAMSIDKISPRIFGKGVGINNEPRNALIIAVIIAEAGILIGELNVIARIVSIFYLTAYGFLNLAFALEKWASVDFRPSFKISRWYGIIGFLACFMIMFKMDMLAMIFALLIMILLYTWLRKRHLQLDFGDVWQSVRTHIVRNTLDEISKKDIEPRNWRPNILLFSGREGSRPHLLELGKALIGAYGFLSDFELIEKSDKDVTLTRSQQLIQSKGSLQQEGVFSRKHICKDVYEGIDNISSTYGFSGIEPNTILMGWARQSKNPKRFVEMLKNLESLDMNIIMMDYDKKKGFGKQKLIDIWIDPVQPLNSLGFSLVKILKLSGDWNKSTTRLMVHSINIDHEKEVYHKLKSVTDIYRLDVDICMIQSQDGISFYETMKNESRNSDLIFINILEIASGNEQRFVDRINSIVDNLGTVILTKSSSFFGTAVFGEVNDVKQDSSIYNNVLPLPRINEGVNYPSRPLVARHFKDVNESIISSLDSFQQEFVQKHFNQYIELTKKIENSFKRRFEDVFLSQPEPDERLLYRSHQQVLSQIRRALIEFKVNFEERNLLHLPAEIKTLINNLQRTPSEVPNELSIYLDIEEIIAHKKEIPYTFYLRKRVSYYFKRKSIAHKLKFRDIVKRNLIHDDLMFLQKNLELWSERNIEIILEIQSLISYISDLLQNIQNEKVKNIKYVIDITKTSKLISKKAGTLILLIKEKSDQLSTICFSNHQENLSKTSMLLDKIYPNSAAKISNKLPVSSYYTDLQESPTELNNYLSVLLQSLIVETQLFAFSQKYRRIIEEIRKTTSLEISSTILKDCIDLISYLKNNTEAIIENQGFGFEFSADIEKLQNRFQQIQQELNARVGRNLEKLPKSILLLDKEKALRYAINKDELIKPDKISLRLLVNFISQREITSLIHNLLDESRRFLVKNYETLKDTRRLIVISTQDELDEEIKAIALTRKDKIELLNEQVENLIKTKKEIQEFIVESDKFLEERADNLSKDLSLSELAKDAANVKQYIRKEESKKRFMWIRQEYNHLREGTVNLMNQFWYRQSKGILLAGKISSYSAEQTRRIPQTLIALDHLKYSPTVKEALPLYYQQLFLGKSVFYDEFWVGRKREIEKAKGAIQRYQSGNSGAILIIGEEKGGKSHFSQYIALNICNASNIYSVTPPPEGSIDTEVFFNYLGEACGLQDPIDDTIGDLPYGSVIIFNNIELWWEKSQNGFVLIEQIKKLIDKHCRHVIFLLNINAHTYHVINRLRKLEDDFIEIIRLDPLNAEMLRDLILLRHKSSIINLVLNGRKEDKIPSLEYAKLFSKYFVLSMGNPGVALRLWIDSIKKVEDDTIHISYPKNPDMKILETYPGEWFLVLLQFMLHKRLSIERLSRILHQDTKKVENIVNILARSGLINEVMKSIFEINEYFYPFIKNKLIEKEML